MLKMSQEGADLSGERVAQSKLGQAIRYKLDVMRGNGVAMNQHVSMACALAIPMDLLRKLRNRRSGFVSQWNNANLQDAQKMISGIQEVSLLALGHLEQGRLEEAMAEQNRTHAPLRLKWTKFWAGAQTMAGRAMEHGTVTVAFGLFSIAGIDAGLRAIEKAGIVGCGAVEAFTRFSGSCFMFMQTVCKAVEKTVQTLPKIPWLLRFGVQDWLESKASIGGKFFGRIAGGLIALADGMKAFEKGAEGDYGLAALYFVSAIVAFALIFATGWLAFILFLISIGITYGIIIIEGNPFENWMKRCWFGTESKKKRYKTVGAEQAEFMDAFKSADVAI
jgi:hypothetical protein